MSIKTTTTQLLPRSSSTNKTALCDHNLLLFYQVLQTHWNIFSVKIFYRAL